MWAKSRFHILSNAVTLFSLRSSRPAMFSTSILPHVPSSHNSITINTREVNPIEKTEFNKLLSNTIEAARDEGKSACWLKLPAEHGHYIPLASELGFKFHHAEDDTATMALWLPKDVGTRIPRYATHQIGVGGMVISGRKENGEPDKVLVIKEVNKVNNNYKFPGGLADPGEHFSDAAIREVKEETGVESEFVSLLTIRHTHEVQFGVSDIYVIALLNALSTDIDKCNYEIEEAIWMDYAEFKKSTKHPMFKAAVSVIDGEAHPLIEEEYPNIIAGRPPYKLYHAPRAEK